MKTWDQKQYPDRLRVLADRSEFDGVDGKADCIMLNVVASVFDGMDDPKLACHWLIEMQGPAYLGARKLGGHEFYWTPDANKALWFGTNEQADMAMMVIRELKPDLFPLCLTKPIAAVEHGFYDKLHKAK